MNRRRQRGFTVIEILIAVAVTAVGFAAIFSLQIGSMQGNISARDLSAAMNLAERYAEVLRRDSYEWNARERPGPRLSRSTNEWHSFTPNAVDHNGLASLDDDPEFGSELFRQRFCVHYWFAPLEGLYNRILNVRVRVIWPRTSMDPSGLVDVCPEDSADGFRLNVRDWYSVVIPMTLRSNDAQ
jgi:prepilin-type N-terminal cleavage/methylation domain-containing protein